MKRITEHFVMYSGNPYQHQRKKLPLTHSQWVARCALVFFVVSSALSAILIAFAEWLSRRP